MTNDFPSTRSGARLISARNCFPLFRSPAEEFLADLVHVHDATVVRVGNHDRVRNRVEQLEIHSCVLAFAGTPAPVADPSSAGRPAHRFAAPGNGIPSRR
jgi:hypothetical protein